MKDEGDATQEVECQDMQTQIPSLAKLEKLQRTTENQQIEDGPQKSLLEGQHGNQYAAEEGSCLQLHRGQEPDLAQ